MVVTTKITLLFIFMVYFFVTSKDIQAFEFEKGNEAPIVEFKYKQQENPQSLYWRADSKLPPTTEMGFGVELDDSTSFNGGFEIQNNYNYESGDKGKYNKEGRFLLKIKHRLE